MKYITSIPSQTKVKQVHRSMKSYRKTRQSYTKTTGTESKKYSELNTRLLYMLHAIENIPPTC